MSSPSPSLSSSISSPSHTNSSPSHHSLSSGEEEDAPAVPHPTHSDMTDFYEGLASLSSKPAILSFIEPHSSNYVTDLLDDELPLCLSGLLKHEYMKYSYSELLKLSQGFTHTVTPEQAEALAIRTHSQAKSSLWFRMRAGRITASNFKSVSHTDESSPSLSLIMSICHPEISKFRNNATAWGIQHEKLARDKYSSYSSLNHVDFKVSLYCVPILILYVLLCRWRIVGFSLMWIILSLGHLHMVLSVVLVADVV